jgi:hypothetical protein
MELVWAMLLRAAAAALAIAAVVGPAPAAAAHVTVLVETQRSIDDIDANAGWLVWRHSTGLRRFPGRPTVIRHRSWVTGKTSTLYRCHSRTDDLGDEMAAAGAAVVWTRRQVEGQGCCDLEFDTRLRTSGSGAPRDVAFRELGCGGDEIGSLTARGNLAAYNKSIWTSTFCPGNPTRGQDSMTGGHVRLLDVRSGAPGVMTGSPPAALIALSTGRLALVPYDLSAGTINGPPPPRQQIQVWSLGSRALERTIPETGTITGVAIKNGRIAALVSDGVGGFRIDRVVAATGAADGSTAVAGSVAPQLSIWRNFIVYAAGHTVRALSTSTGRVHVVARITRRPFDVLAVNGRAIWLSSGPHLSRISSAPIR